MASWWRPSQKEVRHTSDVRWHSWIQLDGPKELTAPLHDCCLVEQSTKLSGDFLRAIELDPNYANAHHWYGELLSVTGRHQEAILQAKRALEIEPLSLVMTRDGASLLFRAASDAAAAQCRKTLELNSEFAQRYIKWD